MSAGAERVNVLAVMDRAIERNRERGAAIGSPSDRSLREARDAVRELIEDARLLSCSLAAAYAAMEMEPPREAKSLLQRHLGASYPFPLARVEPQS